LSCTGPGRTLPRQLLASLPRAKNCLRQKIEGKTPGEGFGL